MSFTPMLISEQVKGKGKLSGRMISWFCGYICSLQRGTAWVFSVGRRRLFAVVWRLILQPTAPRGGHRKICSWSLWRTPSWSSPSLLSPSEPGVLSFGLLLSQSKQQRWRLHLSSAEHNDKLHAWFAVFIPSLPIFYADISVTFGAIWSQMILGGEKICQEVPGVPKFFLDGKVTLVQGGSRWFKVVQGGSRWFQVVHVGSGGCQV